MYGDTWQVRWKEFLSDSYVYGSKIEFNEDGSVSYKNRLMPPGTVIHTWYSMTNFQGNRIEPSLPLIDGERAYSIAVNIDYHNSESEALMLRIIFFDRYDVQAQSIIVRDKKAFFKPSIRTYSSYKLDAGLSKSDMQSAATVSDYLMLRVYQGLSRQRERIGDEEAYEQFVREATLKAVDDGWVELIDYLEQLKYAVAGRASAQRNVMFEYQNEAFESFLDTEKAVKCNIIRNILLSDVKIGKDGRLQVIYP